MEIVLWLEYAQKKLNTGEEQPAKFVVFLLKKQGAPLLPLVK